MRNLLITLQFDGTNYHGWQVQQNALSVQEVFQTALGKVIKPLPDIKGCSRTDSGVHAREYCLNFHTDHTIPCERLVAALNRWLPFDMAVTACCEVPDEFHARYSCSGKEYIYRIWNAPVRDPFLHGYVLHYWYSLNEKMLNQAAQAFVGSHDFRSFCTLDERDPGDLVRTVRRFEVKREGNLLLMAVEADGFLYNMVRIMVGTLLRIAQGKFAPDSIPLILEKRDRSFAGPTAPACGLCLNRVFYEGEVLGCLEEKKAIAIL